MWVLIAAAMGLAVSVTPGPPDLTIRYEAPLYGANSEHGESFDHYGARWFDFWKDMHSFAHIPGPSPGKNCLRPDLYFCIHLDEFLFAVPPPGAKPGAMWVVDHYVKFRLLAIRTVRFRGRDIEVYLIKADTSPTPDGVMLASVFSYSYEWGVIGFANVWSETYYFRDPRAPINLDYVYALASDYGLGGRENCKYWPCGTIPGER